MFLQEAEAVDHQLALVEQQGAVLGQPEASLVLVEEGITNSEKSKKDAKFSIAYSFKRRIGVSFFSGNCSI